MNYYHLRQFAQTYSCNEYGSGSYSNQGECVAAVESGPQNLSNTGVDVAIGAGAGVLLITLGVVLLIKLRRNKKTTKK